jgi:hypothetical protein
MERDNPANVTVACRRILHRDDSPFRPIEITADVTDTYLRTLFGLHGQFL